MNEQPPYQSLITVHGRIIADNRAPPEPYNKRHDGIYIQTNNGNINVYCDHPKQLLIGYGASRGGGTYDLGQCKWVSGKMKKYGFCATGNEIACQDPRFFYGHEVVVKMNAEQTIYELTIDEDKKIYSYQNMLLFYKEQYLFLGYVYYSITFIFLLFLFCRAVPPAFVCLYMPHDFKSFCLGMSYYCCNFATIKTSVATRCALRNYMY